MDVLISTAESVTGLTLNRDILAKLIAKALGYAILLGSLGLKVPQIINLVSSKNVEGISPISYYSDVYLYILSASYNYLQGNPISSYGDNISVLIQNLILVFVLWTFMKKPPSVVVKIGVLASFALTFAAILHIPLSALSNIMYINLLLILSSRLPQISENMKQQSTGQLSTISFFLQFIGSAIRIFTTIQEVGWDWSLLSGFVMGASLNGIILLQIALYSKKSANVSDEKKKR